MKFDSVIIGGGLSGLLCGLRLARAGRHCAIISSGQSALHFSSGSLDLLGALPDGSVVENPVEAVKALSEQAPEHPYSKIGVERFGALADEAAALLSEAGGKVEGTSLQNHYRLTPMGTFKPTWLTMDGYVRSDNRVLAWKHVALFNAEGFLDFYPQFIADELRKTGIECELHTFNMAALETVRRNPTEMRSSNIARIFDCDENLDELARIIKAEMGDCEAVLLPALLGIERTDGVARLAEKTGRPVAIVATLPPSVNGIRMQRALRHAFEQAGGTYFLGDTAVGCERQGDKITALYTVNHVNIPFVADDYVLATGSYFSRGLVAEHDCIKEPLFGLDVEAAAERSGWYDRNFFEKQAFEGFGIKTDKTLHGLCGGERIANLYVVGAGLAGFNPLAEGCGAGVSMLTALHAADCILNKQ